MELDVSSESTPGRTRWTTWALLVVGILGGQLWLYWPSLVGRRLLAPTDLLTAPGALNVHAVERVRPPQHVMMDPVQVFYPWLDFAAHEVRAGRLPVWNPYAYCGSPFLANMQSAVYSPFTAVYYLWPNPRALVWIQVLKALVAGVGAFGFLRAVGTSSWPALVGGWCFPLVGYLTVWLNYPLSAAAVWLPAGFWCVAALLRRPSGHGGPGLACVVGLMLVSGHLETTAHVLLGMAVYGLATWLWSSRGRVWEAGPRRVATTTALAMGLGFALGAVQVLPTLAYVRSSHRLKLRREFQAERGYAANTLGWEAVRLAFPLLAGTEQPGSRPLTATGLHESGANGYASMTLLVLVPVGVVAGRRRFDTWLWLLLAVWFAAPMFRIPLLRWWDHVPPFSLAANSRALLLTGWAILVLGVKGLDALGKRPIGRNWGVGAAAGFAIVLLLGLSAAWLEPSLLRARVPTTAWPWFRAQLVRSVVVCGLTLLGLLAAALAPRGRHAAGIGLGVIALAELLTTAHGLNPQVDPATFYPESPLCRFLGEHAGGGRICGLWGALPPNLAMRYGLRDVRGYDAVDPDPFVELLLALRGHFGPPHAMTWQFGRGPSPVLDMLGVRLFVCPVPRPEFGVPVWQASGVWAYRNPRAMPRAFIPRRASLVPEPSDRLRRLSEPGFDPRGDALISAAARLPAGAMSGTASVVAESPAHVTLAAECATDAVLVLADGWAPGWSVSVDGRAADVLQANHALRAVVVPRGKHTVVWRYRPSAVVWGIRCCAIGLVGVAAFAVGVARSRPNIAHVLDDQAQGAEP